MTSSDKLEFIGQIIDIFEDFLDEKGVKIDNPDRDRDAIGDAACGDTNIYGCDYGDLSDRIESTMTNWGFFKMDNMKTPSFDMDWADRAEALAHDIYTWCIENDCWQDVCIYYNGKRMSTSGKDKTGKTVYRYGGTPFIEDNMDPRDYFTYVREPNILSMSFEGTLYDILNNRDMFALQDLFSKYGLYYECGNAWNLSAYPINE